MECARAEYLEKYVPIQALTQILSLGGELKQPETKEAEPLQPSLKVFTVSQEKNCYIVYAAAEQVDHFKFNVVCSPINAKPSSDCLNELNPSTDLLRMAV